MVKYVLHVSMLLSFTVVVSEWVELPQMTPTRGVVTYTSADISMASTQSNVAALFTEEFKAVSEPNQFEENKSAGSDIKIQVNYEKEYNSYYNDDLPIRVAYNKSDPSIDFGNATSNEVMNDIQESHIIEEAINQAKNDFLNQPFKSIREKLEYLKQLENKLLLQTRLYTQDIWIDRQSRGKKLLGFPSMEGALMTIAFLTFAVFLIKIVRQCIQGLQNAEQTLLMTLATPSPIRLSSKPNREKRNLAAVQILKYIDEYSIKHKLHCDFS